MAQKIIQTIRGNKIRRNDNV